MLWRTLLAVLLAGGSFPALCQPQPKQLIQITQVPDYMIYDAFFFRVNWLNDLADKLDGKGQDGTWARLQIAAQARLTKPERQAINNIAADYRTTSNVIVAQIVVLSRGGVSAANSQQILNLQGQRVQNVLDHIAQLQSSLGGPRFQQFAGYVHKTASLKAFADPSTIPVQSGKEPL